MTGEVYVTGRLVAAARALIGVSQTNFATAACISPTALDRIESAGSASIDGAADLVAVQRAFEHFGVIVIAEGEGMGAGIRLKFTRGDVRQLARLEGEGGLIGSDDAP